MNEAEIQYKTPRYLELTEQLRLQVRTGVLKTGDRLPSFAEMREQYGASQATMERVYSLLEGEGLIVREPGRGIYIRETRRTRTGLLGFLGNAFQIRNRSAYATHVVEGIQEMADKLGQQIVLLNTDRPGNWEQIDGVLSCNVEARRLLAQLPPDMACVSLLRPINGVTSIVADDYAGAFQMVEHLVEQGHRRISCFMETNRESVRLRFVGYCNALRNAGIELQPSWIWHGDLFQHGQNLLEFGRDSMRTWLADEWRELDCTAIVAQNDHMAAGVIEALHEAGLNVPEQVSVTGFDSTDICDYFTPRITAVEVPLHEIGARSVELLLQQLQDDLTGTETIVLPTKITVRDSTAPPSKGVPISSNGGPLL